MLPICSDLEVTRQEWTPLICACQRQIKLALKERELPKSHNFIVVSATYAGNYYFSADL